MFEFLNCYSTEFEHKQCSPNDLQKHKVGGRCGEVIEDIVLFLAYSLAYRKHKSWALDSKTSPDYLPSPNQTVTRKQTLYLPAQLLSSIAGLEELNGKI